MLGRSQRSRRLQIAALLAALVWSTPSLAEGPRELADYLRLATEGHPVLAAARESTAAAAELPAARLKPLVPRLTLGASASQQREPLLGMMFSLLVPATTQSTQSVNLDFGVEGGVPIGLDYRLAFTNEALGADAYQTPLSPGYQPSLRLTLTQRLWRGVTPAAFFASQHVDLANVTAAEANALQRERDVMVRVAEAFLWSARAAAISALRERALVHARAFEQVTRELIEGGQQSRLELALALQTVQQRKSELELAAAEQQEALLGLAGATGLSPDDPSHGGGIAPLAAVAGWALPTLTKDEAVARAVERDPGLLSLAAEARRLEAERTLVADANRPDIRLVVDGYVSGLAGTSQCKGGYLVDGFTPCGVPAAYQGGYDKALANMATGQLYGASVGVQGDIPTFPGPWFAEGASVERRIAALQHERLAVERAIAWEVTRRHAEVASRLALLEAVATSVKLAEGALDAENTKMRAGRSTNFDVIRSQELLVAAQLEQVNAMHSYAVALVHLRARLDELSPENAGLFPAAP